MWDVLPAALERTSSIDADEPLSASSIPCDLAAEPSNDIEPREISRTSFIRARMEANRVVHVIRRLGHSALNKLEGIVIGLLGVTEAMPDVGEGLGQKSLSGVGAVGSFVEAGIQGALSGVPQFRLPPPTEVDISSTVLRDLNRAIEVEQLRSTSNAESPFNTPFILLIVPMLPIVLMYNKTAMSIAVPPLFRALVACGVLLGDEFGFAHLCQLFLALLLFAKQSRKPFH